jgi:cell fate regulator YaaT (PSP1 superfamily)
MCCLKYEHPLYAEFARTAPAVGARVSTDEGEGVVVAHQVPSDSVVVRMRDSGAITSCSRASVCGSRAAYSSREKTDQPARRKRRHREVEREARQGTDPDPAPPADDPAGDVFGDPADGR